MITERDQLVSDRIEVFRQLVTDALLRRGDLAGAELYWADPSASTIEPDGPEWFTARWVSDGSIIARVSLDDMADAYITLLAARRRSLP